MVNVVLKVSEKTFKVEGNIDVIEHMGNECYVHFNTMGLPFTAKIDSMDSQDLRIENKINFMFNMKSGHTFDFHCEENITL